MFTNHTSDKGLISKIYQEFIQLNIQKQVTWFKNGQRTWIFSPKKTYKWSRAPENILSITNLQENATHNNEILLHGCHIAQKAYIDLMQSLSRFQWHFLQKLEKKILKFGTTKDLNSQSNPEKEKQSKRHHTSWLQAIL